MSPTIYLRFLALVAIGWFAAPTSNILAQTATPELESRQYQVRPDFLSLGGYPSEAPSEDPFADEPAEPVPETPKWTAQEILEAFGVLFPDGASAQFNPKTSQLTVVNTPDSHVLIELVISENQADVQRQIRLLLECITLSHARAAELVHQHMNAADATPLRNALRSLISAGKARITASEMVTTRSGQRAKSESVTEEIYPAEHDPGHVPMVATGELNGNPNFTTPVRVTAFRTRNAGIILEIDPVVGSDAWTIDMNLTVNNTVLLNSVTLGTGLSTFTLPEFYTERIATATTLGDGTCQLVAITTPENHADVDERTLVFIRPTILEKPKQSTLPPDGAGPRLLSLLVEWFDLNSAAAAELTDMETSFLDDTPKRQRVLELVVEGEASRLETSYLVSRSGVRANVSSVSEVIYPEQITTPSVPTESTFTSETQKLIIPASPSSLTTRAVGTILEMEAVVGSGGRSVDLVVTPEISKLLGWDSYGREESKVDQPVFASMRSTFSMRLIPGQPALLAVQNPVDQESQDTRSDRRIVVFVTAAVQEVKP